MGVRDYNHADEQFPSMVTRYVDRNRIKSKGCNSGLSERPMRKNSETLVRFPGLCSLDISGKEKMAGKIENK